MAKQFDVHAVPSGAVRVSADLYPEEARHSFYMRDYSPEEARAAALELMQKADEAEKNRKRLGI